MNLKIKDLPQPLLFCNKNTFFMDYRYFEETLLVCFVLALVPRSHCKVVKNNRMKIRIKRPQCNLILIKKENKDTYIIRWGGRCLIFFFPKNSNVSFHLENLLQSAPVVLPPKILSENLYVGRKFYGGLLYNNPLQSVL